MLLTIKLLYAAQRLEKKFWHLLINLVSHCETLPESVVRKVLNLKLLQDQLANVQGEFMSDCEAENTLKKLKNDTKSDKFDEIPRHETLKISVKGHLLSLKRLFDFKKHEFSNFQKKME